MGRLQAFTLLNLADLIAAPFALRMLAEFDAESPGRMRRSTCRWGKRARTTPCRLLQRNRPAKQPLLRGNGVSVGFSVLVRLGWGVAAAPLARFAKSRGRKHE